MSDIRSERAALAACLTHVQAIKRAFGSLVDRAGASGADWQYGRRALTELETELRALMAQVQGGIHANPPLVIYGNPPLVPLRRPGIQKGPESFRYFGQMSRSVHEVRYTHIADGKDYRHEFGEDVEMYAVTSDGKFKDVLLTGGSGQPLWKDFE